MNETLRRAMFEARLTDGDLAARLHVNPKTVRRWLDGRLPYPRHRAELARLLDVDEEDLWPELRALRAAASKPAEIIAVYPRRGLIPEEAWATLLGSAQREINILSYSAGFLLEQPDVLNVLDERSAAGTRVAIALADTKRLDLARVGAEAHDEEALETHIAEAVDLVRPMSDAGRAELRLHNAVLFNSIYRADDQVLINQHIYGFPPADSPVFHLQRIGGGEMFDFYMSSFDRIWSHAVPVGR